MPAKETEQPLTISAVARWVAFASVVLGLGAYGWNIQRDVTVVQIEQQNMRRYMDDRRALRDKQVDDLSRRVSEGERVYSDLARKLDVAVALLERIEKQTATNRTTELKKSGGEQAWQH